jgi:hypothetical protein
MVITFPLEIQLFYLNGETMKNFLKKSNLAITVAALGFLSVAGTAQANVFEIDFMTANYFVGNAAAIPALPGLNTVFATALFDDHGSSGSVTLTMHVLSNLSAGAYVNDWYFNTSTAPLNSITYVSGQAASLVQTGVINSYKADGTGGKFDFAFHFPTANPGQLAQGNTSVYTLIDSGLTAASFNSLSVPAPNGGNYLSALHVQGYGNSAWIGGTQNVNPPCPDCSVVTVPEPTTLLLMSAGLFGFGLARHRKSA